MKLALLLLFPLMAFADCATNWMDCTTDSHIQIASVEMRAKETIAAITSARAAATRGLQAHKITVTEAKGVLDKTDRARALWQEARAACLADDAGNCATQAASVKAFALLTQAKEAIK